MIPTRKLLMMLLVPIVFLPFVPAGHVVLIACDALLALLALLDARVSPRPDHLSITDELPPRLSLDAPNRTYVEVHNAGPALVHFQLTRDLPEGIEGQPPMLSGALPAGARARCELVLRPMRRGLFECGDLHLRYQTVMGLLTRRRRFAARRPVKVYPNVANLARYELAMRRHRLQEIGLRSVRQRGKGTLFESLRDYVEGDDLSDVAWKATARRGRMVIRNFETERSQNILIVLDCGRLMTTQVDRMSRLDYAVNAALLLTYVAMKQGDFIGVVAFSDGVKRYVPPIRGRGALGRVGEALYALEPTLAEPNYEEACRFLALRHRKRSLIVLFTDVIDPQASSMLLAYSARFARRHLPLCVVMRHLELESMLQADPPDAAAAFAQAVAAQMLERRAEALTRMRGFGVDVLDADPRTLTPTVLDRYLSLKRRNRF